MEEEEKMELRIQGLQKLTLLDYPEKVACTVFTAGCNFRCPFCHNASLVTGTDLNEDIEPDEIIAFLKKRTKILDGVCITGGEPLLWPGILEFMSRIKELGYQIKLDTNGSDPSRLIEIVEKGLVDYVAVDIKNSKENYGRTIGIKDYDLAGIEESVRFLLEDHVDYEFRTTVVRQFHRKKDFELIGQWIKGAKRYCLQAFVDSGDLIGEGLSGYEKAQMEEAREIAAQYVKLAILRGI